MALALCKLATIILVAATGIKAAPTSDDTELLARASASVVNGDFSAPLLGTWSVTRNCQDSTHCLPSNGFHRVKSNGNSVAQIDGVTYKCTAATAAQSIIKGTIDNLVAGQVYILSFDYKFAAATTYKYWHDTSVTHAFTDHPVYTRAAKANKWYTFSIQVHVSPSHSGSQTLSIVYFDCDNVGNEPPDVQLDNFRIAPMS